MMHFVRVRVCVSVLQTVSNAGIFHSFNASLHLTPNTLQPYYVTKWIYSRILSLEHAINRNRIYLWRVSHFAHCTHTRYIHKFIYFFSFNSICSVCFLYSVHFNWIVVYEYGMILWKRICSFTQNLCDFHLIFFS